MILHYEWISCETWAKQKNDINDRISSIWPLLCRMSRWMWLLYRTKNWNKHKSRGMIPGSFVYLFWKDAADRWYCAISVAQSIRLFNRIFSDFFLDVRQRKPEEFMPVMDLIEFLISKVGCKAFSSFGACRNASQFCNYALCLIAYLMSFHLPQKQDDSKKQNCDGII